MPQIIAASSPKAAVAVNFAEVGKDALDVVQRIRTVGMARQFGALPGGQLARHLAAQRVDAVVQRLQLLLRFLIVAGSACSCSICFSIFSSSSCAFEDSFHIGIVLFVGGPVHRLGRVHPEIQRPESNSGLLRA